MDVNVGETDASLVVGKDAKSQFMRRDMRFKGVKLRFEAMELVLGRVEWLIG